MAFLLDTNVAIHLRDGDPTVTQKVGALEGAVLISVVTRVELEGRRLSRAGAGAYSQGAARRHAERYSSVGVRRSCGEDLWDHCRQRWLLAAEAPQPHDRGSSSGAPRDLGHLQSG